MSFLIGLFAFVMIALMAYLVYKGNFGWAAIVAIVGFVAEVILLRRYDITLTRWYLIPLVAYLLTLVTTAVSAYYGSQVVDWDDIDNDNNFKIAAIVGLIAVVFAIITMGLNIYVANTHALSPKDAEANIAGAPADVAPVDTDPQPPVAPTNPPEPAPTAAPEQIEPSPMPTAIPPTLPTFTPVPAETVIQPGQPIDYYFQFGKPLECTPVNAEWTKVFKNEDGTYTIDLSNTEVLPAGRDYQVEGVPVGANPKDEHNVYFLTENVDFIQANIWDCGVGNTDADKHATAVWSLVQKIDSWDDQAEEPFHSTRVKTAYGEWSFDAGVYPPSPLPIPGVCQYPADKLYEQEALPDQQEFITLAGSGCDYVVLKPGKADALRLKIVERYPWVKGMLVFTFNPNLTNEEVEAMLKDLGYEVTVTNE